jgi:hypothetical protein
MIGLRAPRESGGLFVCGEYLKREFLNCSRDRESDCSSGNQLPSSRVATFALQKAKLATLREFPQTIKILFFKTSVPKKPPYSLLGYIF